MVRFKKILCPIDFSETSIKVLQWSECLAKQIGSSITALHAIDIPLTVIRMFTIPKVLEGELAKV
jgi:hypothetical protein